MDQQHEHAYTEQQSVPYNTTPAKQSLSQTVEKIMEDVVNLCLKYGATGEITFYLDTTGRVVNKNIQLHTPD